MAEAGRDMDGEGMVTLVEEHKFRLLQGGMVVAVVTASDRAAAFREIIRYAAVYAQDGPVSIEGVEPSDWEAWRTLPKAGER